MLERHAHSARVEQVPGAAADATVAWNDVDLRLRAAAPLRLELSLDAERLWLRVRSPLPMGQQRKPTIALRPARALVHTPVARGCLTCDEQACFRHRGLPVQQGRGAPLAIVDSWQPEWAAWMAQNPSVLRGIEPWRARAAQRGRWLWRQPERQLRLAGMLSVLAATGLTRLYERSDVGVRQLEGLESVRGWLRGEGATAVELNESSWRLTLDVAEGHKTGYYLDQRDNRADFARWVRQLGAKRVLNCFSYTGGFSVAALAGGATEVLSVDSSAPALARASEHVLLNGFDPAHHETLDADVNTTLRRFLAEGQQFDAIVLDPPKFAPTAAHADRASRAYKDINRLGLKLLAPGGLLTTYSCSGGIGAELFQKIVAGAGIDAGVDAYIAKRLEASSDHPTTLCFPEGEYLKGLALLRHG